MNLTTWIVLVSCLAFGLLMGWLAYRLYNRWYYQERLRIRLISLASSQPKIKLGPSFGIKWEWMEVPSVPPHPLYPLADWSQAVGPSPTQSAELSDESPTVNLAAAPIPTLTTLRLRTGVNTRSTEERGPDTSSENTAGRGVSSSWTTP